MARFPINSTDDSDSESEERKRRLFIGIIECSIQLKRERLTCVDAKIKVEAGEFQLQKNDKVRKWAIEREWSKMVGSHSN